MIYRYEDIRAVEVELTTSCNAACPMCPRNDHGGRTVEDLPRAELDLDAFSEIVTPSLLQQLRQIYFCGTYGDPQMARDTLKIVQYVKSRAPHVQVGMSTNGGARAPDWWLALASSLGPSDWVTFAIDGLSDTNALYRQNVRWERVMANARAFIAAGGHARWEFIVFRHNEHQIAAARSIACQMGFDRFITKKTYRFMDKSHQTRDRFPVKDASGNIVRFLEAPRLAAHRNGAMLVLSSLLSQDEPKYLDTAEIQCLAKQQKLLHLTAEGYVLPCGWIYDRLYGTHRASPSSSQLRDLLARSGGLDSIDARKRGVAAIVSGPLFRAIADSWNGSKGVARLERCAVQCGPVAPARAQRGDPEDNIFPLRMID